MNLPALSDNELIASLRALCAAGRQLDVRLIEHLAEIEERSLHLKAACSSMFDFCIRKLGLSEGAAHRRINAARLARRFPTLLGRLERGELHLSGLVVLAKHLKESNADELLSAVAGMSQREIEEFLARHAPRPDVPSQICRLPSMTAPPSLTNAKGGEVVPPRRPMRVEPLSEDRYRVQLTASGQLRDKLERARALMQHRNPSGDLAVVVEQALDALLDKLERERLGKTTRPRRPVCPTKPGKVARGVRREVFERDGEQCTFADDEGNRCPARSLLELDHIEARAKGGSNEASNLRVRCRAHNRLHAEVVFGREHVARRIDLRRRKSKPLDERSDERPRASGATIDDERHATAAGSDLALRGLVHLGFAKSEAQRALDDVLRRHEGGPQAPAIPDLLREAIRILT